MLSSEVLARLGRLNRQSPAGSRSAPRPDCASTSACPPASTSSAAAAPTNWLAGREVETPAGCHWEVEQPLSTLWPQSQRYLLNHRQSRKNRCLVPPDHPQLQQLQAGFPSDLLLLDLETCGFAGSMVFLIGTLYQQDERILIRQFLARDYSEERAILQSLWHLIPCKRMLVTYNGKSFDWPVVQDRSILHRLPLSHPLDGQLDGQLGGQLGGHIGRQGEIGAQGEPVPRGETGRRKDRGPVFRSDTWQHCDVLHHARRRWKSHVPNCRLQTLEWHVCGRRREGDIPGRLIPDAYHDFVRTGDAWQIRSILHHNALDLVTLFQLSLALTRRDSSGESPA